MYLILKLSSGAVNWLFSSDFFFLGGGAKPTVMQFFCYANFSIVLEQNFGDEAKVFQWVASGLRRGGPPSL